MLNIVQFGAAVFEKNFFLSINLYITMYKFKALGWGHLWPRGLHLNTHGPC